MKETTKETVPQKSIDGPENICRAHHHESRRLCAATPEAHPHQLLSISRNLLTGSRQRLLYVQFYQKYQSLSHYLFDFAHQIGPSHTVLSTYC